MHAGPRQARISGAGSIEHPEHAAQARQEPEQLQVPEQLQLLHDQLQKQQEQQRRRRTSRENMYA